ncbi:MAG: hypothetical protein EBZ75_13660, partial [Oxalobacteraceae bacterium]|nr:hypothetical protein [Oxalobacteraceae bacterium]
MSCAAAAAAGMEDVFDLLHKLFLHASNDEIAELATLDFSGCGALTGLPLGQLAALTVLPESLGQLTALTT